MSAIIKKEIGLDPVFASVGQRVFTNSFVEKLRKENLAIKSGKGKKTKSGTLNNYIPQKGFQEKVLLCDADIKIVGGRRGGGKEQPVDCKVVTPFGLRRMGDLKIGDIITCPATGEMQHVIQIYEHPKKDAYRVNFADGTSTECGLEHLWLIHQANYASKSRRINDTGQEYSWRVWTFGQIKEFLDKENAGNFKEKQTSNLIVPLCEPVKFTKSEYSIPKISTDPYIIGVLLSDDSFTSKDKITFSSADIEIVEEMSKLGLDMFIKHENKKSSVVNYVIPKCELYKDADTLKLTRARNDSKFIPTRLKYGTVTERLSLIQGLMDTDGRISTEGKCYYYTTSKAFADDFRFVLESLGGTATITKKEIRYKKDRKFIRRKNVYEIYIQIKDTSMIFRLPHLKERCKSNNGGASVIGRKIVGYEYLGKKDCRCIAVDSPCRLYLTDDFIVTHNTWVALYEALDYIDNPGVNMYGFRKYLDDIKRGIWKSSKEVYKDFAIPTDTSFEWKFLDGKGATMTMEHLQDLKKVSDRFRGVEMAYIVIEELAEHTRDNMNVLFDLLTSNRSTAGIRPRCVATCNPVGKSNSLRKFLDWYINPDTDRVIPERSGKIRYFFKYGDSENEIAWGNTEEEVYRNASARGKLDELQISTGVNWRKLITSLVFIEGEYQDNEILKAADPKYMSRISARGGKSTTNDIVGVWRDVDMGTGLVTTDDMERFFNNTARKDGFMRASADVALTGDFFVIWAFDGHHICDMEAFYGVPSDDVVAFVKNFLRKNGVREENFTYDANGLGLWLSGPLPYAIGFNNKSAPSDSRLWNNLKSESAEKFVKGLKHNDFSIDSTILERRYTDSRGNVFSVADRLMEERLILKRKDTDNGRFEIISKQQMKEEIGHSPDFIEGMFMVMPLYDNTRTMTRNGFDLI